jgi:hypothetical protein
VNAAADVRERVSPERFVRVRAQGSKQGRACCGEVWLANRTSARYVAHSTMLYEVLVLSSGGERFTMERDRPLAEGDAFEQDSEAYRVIAVHTGHGPFDGVIEAERFASSAPDAEA